MGARSTITMIPQFLCPRLSWKAAIPSLAVRPLPHVQTPRIKLLHPFICSTARARQKHNNAYAALASYNQFLSHPSSSSHHRQRARAFSTTDSLHRDHHFDTLKFVQRLKDEGFSEDQSKAMMLVLSDVIEESIQNLTRTMVLREGAYPYRLPLPLRHQFQSAHVTDPTQTLIEVPIPRKWTLRSFALNCSPSIRATRP